MRWGIWPFYAKGKPQYITNARNDGLTTKPMAAARVSGGIVIGGYACAAVAIFFLPPFVGLAGPICGVVAIKGQQINQGIALIVVNFACAAVGMTLGATQNN